ncbi:MAG TPA: basic amino acid ABC transporter substrate-binding protein [Solirubrobacterales bacterium]
MGNSRVTVLLVALAVSAVALFAAGCGDDDDEGGGGGAKLTVGSDVPYPPFEEFGESKTEFTGFDVELVEAVAEKLDREPEFIDTSFDTIFRDLAQGKFEMVASATTITDEREKTVDFSDPYYLAEQSILAKEGSDVKSVADLDGVTVGVQQGTTGQEFVEEETNAAEVRPYPEGPDLVTPLKGGTIDAAVLDIPVAENLAAAQAGIEVAAEIKTGEEYGLVVQQGEEDLLNEVNEALQELKDDGTLGELYEKWLEVEVPEELLTATHEPS